MDIKMTTDKRKEQNRASQKTYQAKKKSEIKQLVALVEELLDKVKKYVN